MTLIEIAHQLAKDAGLEQQQADAIVQAIVEYTDTVAPVTRDYLDKRLADLRADIADKLRDQTRWLTGTFVVLMLVAVILQHFWH